MCTTTKGPKELLGVSVVDEDGEVLLDTLVQPRGTVIDLKTNITGVTMADLEKVTTTCHEVQVRGNATLRRS
jgi:RNA exonuclease 1